MPAQIDYEAALREVGFSPLWVSRAERWRTREQRAGTYAGFRTLVGLLGIAGAPLVAREHRRQPVIAAVEAQEAALRLRGHRPERGASRRVGEPDSRLLERATELHALVSEMTEEEFEGRVALRPEHAHRLAAVVAP